MRDRTLPTGTLKPGTLVVDGTAIPYRDVRGGTTPSSGGGLWLGSDAVDDGSWGYFVGHNPGSFAPVRSLSSGDAVVVCDRSGGAAHLYGEGCVPGGGDGHVEDHRFAGNRLRRVGGAANLRGRRHERHRRCSVGVGRLCGTCRLGKRRARKPLGFRVGSSGLCGEAMTAYSSSSSPWPWSCSEMSLTGFSRPSMTMPFFSA